MPSIALFLDSSCFLSDPFSVVGAVLFFVSGGDSCFRFPRFDCLMVEMVKGSFSPLDQLMMMVMDDHYRKRSWFSREKIVGRKRKEEAPRQRFRFLLSSCQSVQERKKSVPRLCLLSPFALPSRNTMRSTLFPRGHEKRSCSFV